MALDLCTLRHIVKSQREFYLALCTQLVSCDPLAIFTSKVLRKEIETMTSRCLHEGLSFLTKTLPLLGKALDHGLENSRFTIPRGFSHSSKNRSIPAFLQGYFNLVFDCEGILRESAPAEAVKFLRQVLFFVYKLEVPYSEETEERVISSFGSTEAELELLDISSHDFTVERSLTEFVFSDFDPMDIVPRHGPGAVATGERGDAKWDFSRKYHQIHNVYPYYDYFIVGGAREIGDRLKWYKSLEPHDSGVAKVVLVPKDSRGPRLISCEPLEYQWIQQGLGRKMMSHLESFQLTRNNINFTHQDINRNLALESSISRKQATLDLKDASDRVSLQLVREVFSSTPRLLRCLEACRTSSTKLPNGKVVGLSKYAPMGSALCFPVEAYLFWVLIVSALIREGLPRRRAASLVKVYGDDIIVPVEFAEISMQCLESKGLMVNRSKSCIKGFFRESCGMDAFKGVCVTPSRVRKPWTGKPTDGTAFASYTSLANSLAKEGYTSVSSLLFKEIEDVYGALPFGTSHSSYPCREVRCSQYASSENRKRTRVRWNSHLHRVEFFVKTVSTKSGKTTLDGWPRLLRDVISPQLGNPSVVPIPRSTRVKRKWRSVV